MSLLRSAGRQLLRGRSYATEAVATKGGLDFGELTNFASSDELKREVGGLKKAVDDMRELLANQAKTTAPIDFKKYRQTIPAGVVDVFENAAKGIDFPDYVGPEADALVAKFKALEAAATAAEKDSTARIAALKKELDAVRAEKAKATTITLDAILAADPALKKKLDDDVKNDQWY